MKCQYQFLINFFSFSIFNLLMRRVLPTFWLQVASHLIEGQLSSLSQFKAIDDNNNHNDNNNDNFQKRRQNVCHKLHSCNR